jgi:hypothetical protein
MTHQDPALELDHASRSERAFDRASTLAYHLGSGTADQFSGLPTMFRITCGESAFDADTIEQARERLRPAEIGR